ncbi:DUF4337 family protein [Methylocella sp.]|uniref:DUF4337 family protein n=1 Tax=Methylocella sp. TaxID=1978226 RepID=UPI0037838E7F
MAQAQEHAKEAIEHAAHDAGGARFGRNVAMLVAALAALLSLTEIAEKKSQNAYLAHHITASDDWAFYQAKNIRGTVYSLHAELLESLPPDPALREKIEAARAEAKRLDDDEKSNGRRQLATKARASERARDHAFHRYHMLEYAVGALQIAIVLASGSIVARVRLLAWVAGAIGLGAAAAALLVELSVI